MKFHVLTLFPEMIEQGLHTSIIGRAVEQGLLSLNAVNIRDYTRDKHGKVDDYTYGGGAGMLMQAQPVYDAYQAVSKGKKLRTVYVTPQGRPFTQQLAQEFAKEPELVFLCGHYEGIDERVLEEIVTDYVSIGDYVLTGGELPAMVMIDAISRLVPGVLNNESSAETESFHNDLLEYPQYSRPEVWMGKKVPEVLLSGNHTKIAQWRLEQSKERTRRVRPDLYAKYQVKEKLIKQLSKEKRNHIHMMESLARGRGEVLYHKGENILIYDWNMRVAMIKAADANSAKDLLERLPREAVCCETTQDFVAELLTEKWGLVQTKALRNACYTQKDSMYLRKQDASELEGEGFPFGAFVEGPMEREKVAYIVNKQKEQGFIPYLRIHAEDQALRSFLEELGLYISQGIIYRVEKPEKL